MDALTRLCKHYGSDKAEHGFSAFYHPYFEPIRNDVTKVLEIGIRSGASLCAWRDYFPHAEVHGIDIVHLPDTLGERILTHRCDQASREALQGLMQEVGGEFDIIIDDGGHTMSQQQISLAVLLPYVKAKGFYIIEDLQTSFVAQIRITNESNVFLYDTEADVCVRTTYDCVQQLASGKPYKSYYCSQSENLYINKYVAAVEIFDRDEDRLHVTSILHKN